ncbi:MAG: uroporphyrinogen-III synthase, partial [Polyangiaceae bacterium]
VFTSANAARRLCEGLGHDVLALGHAKLAAIGPATARVLEEHGLRVNVVPADSRGEGMAAAMLDALSVLGPAAGPVRVLLPRASRAREVFPDALRAAGHAVDVVAVYETRPPPREAVDALAVDLAEHRVDAVTFTSSSSVDHLCTLLGPAAADLLRACRVASIGPITTEAARARGVRVDVTAKQATIGGLVRALVESFA